MPPHRVVAYIQMAARALDMDIYMLYVPDNITLAFNTGSLLGVMQLKFAPSHQLHALVFEAATPMSFLGRMLGSIRGADGSRIFCYSALTQCSINLLMLMAW